MIGRRSSLATLCDSQRLIPLLINFTLSLPFSSSSLFSSASPFFVIISLFVSSFFHLQSICLFSPSFQRAGCNRRIGCYVFGHKRAFVFANRHHYHGHHHHHRRRHHRHHHHHYHGRHRRRRHHHHHHHHHYHGRHRRHRRCLRVITWSFNRPIGGSLLKRSTLCASFVFSGMFLSGWMDGLID